MQDVEKISLILKAGNVRRYHARQLIHDQNVSEHTWRIMALYCHIYGPPRREVWQYMLYHDVTEIITGDLPFTLKRDYPRIKQELKRAEDDADVHLGLNTKDFGLNEDELYRVKRCDLIEMKRFAHDEMAMGNSTMKDVVDNIDQMLFALQMEEFND